VNAFSDQTEYNLHSSLITSQTQIGQKNQFGITLNKC